MGRHYIRLLHNPPRPISASNMLSLVSFAALFSVAQALFAPALLSRTAQDTCGAVNAQLRVPPGQPNAITIGFISASLTYLHVFRTVILTPREGACLCLSDIPSFMTTNAVARGAVLLVGQAAAMNAVTALVVSDFR